MSSTGNVRFERLRQGLVALATLIGALTLVGWWAWPGAMAEATGWLRPMPPLSAVIAIGGAVALVARPALSKLLAGLILIGGLVITGALVARPDLLVHRVPALPVPTIGVSLITSGLALLLRDVRSARGVWIMQGLVVAGMLNALRELLGLIPAEQGTLLAAPGFTASPQGLLCIFVVGVGLLVTRPGEGGMALLLSERPGGRLLRWLIAAGVMGPLVAGLLTQAAWSVGLFGIWTGLVLVIAGNLLAFYLVARAYDRADLARQAAEERLARANVDLERRVAERTAALAEREAQISAIGDNLPGVMIYQTLEREGGPFCFTYLSAGVERISGLAVDAVLARPELLYDQITPEARARLLAAEAVASRSQSGLDVEVEKRTPWGPRWSRIRSRPRPLSDGRIVWDGIEVDITAEKRVAAAVERDRRFQAALFACSQALLRAGETPAGREAALREALEHLLAGVQADRAFLMGMVVPPDAEPFVELQLEICAPGTAPSLMSPTPLHIPVAILAPLVSEDTAPEIPIVGTLEELRARSPAFADLVGGLGVRSLIVIPLRQSNGLWGGVGFHDCTAPRVWDEAETLLLRTAAELIGGARLRWDGDDELRRREKILATLFDIMPVGVAILDADGQPVRLNAATGQIAGLDVNTIADGAYNDFRYIHPDGTPVEPSEYASTRALAGEEVRDFENGVISPAGVVRWVSISAAPLPIPGMGAAMVAVDITERRRAEAERLSFERKLLEAQRMESLGVLAGGVAHDFNNILATILGHAELARLDIDPASEAFVSLDAIVLGARRAADLTGQMLAYAGRGRFITEAVDLNQAARELSELTRATLPRGVGVRLSLAPEPGYVVADGTQVRQVLLNLLTNAGEAIVAKGQGGTVVVATGSCELTPELLAGATITAAAPGPHGFIEVGDTGDGIAPETMARIFEPFFSTKFTGRGLGLAAVQGIIRAHRGALFVRSAPGEGATFRACFPLTPEGVTG